MTRQTGIIITVVVAVVTLCCSATCCLAGLVLAFGEQLDIGYDVEWYFGLPLICLALLVWVLPLLAWYFLVRGKEESTRTVGEYLE
ncbi:MAG: hypothetical protein N2508_13345 [Anaerolineae bacterium]|nr:hypothetical protein [Anaerolineae bacterium]